MPRTIYALLVGIDRYPSPIRPLKGCVNDIKAIETLLRERIAGDDYRFEPLVLTDAAATRQAVIDGFRTHLRRAGADDVALFYYSGHGAQEAAPPEFWPLEPDKHDETLVCYDSRQQGRYDLADKELSKLIAEVAERNPHIVIVLDCCHSGSGTRAVEAEAVRRAPTDTRQRPLESFIVGLEEAEALSAPRRTMETATDWVTLPQGRHIVISACRDDEEAKEYQGDGQTRGALSYFLVDTLQRFGGALTYRDLFKRANALVRENVVRQSPQIEASDVRDLDQPFLGGAVRASPPYFTLTHDPTHGWVVDGGAVHGLPPVAGDETTTFALFLLDSAPEQLRDLQGAEGTARVTEVLPAQSKVTVTMRGGGTPDPQLTFKAVVTGLPVPPLVVAFEGDDAALSLAREALAAAGPDGRASLYVCEADGAAAPALRLLARDAVFHITRPADERPLVAGIAGYDAATARQAVQRLEHIARWRTISELANPASRIAPEAVRMEIHRVVGPPVTRSPDSYPTEPLPTNADVRVQYEQQDGTWKEPRFKIKLSNGSDQRLYCALLALTETYAVQSGLLPGAGVWLNPGEEVWANNNRPIKATVPDHLWQQGVTEFKDQIKLIVSTAECDATLLEQEDLDVPLVPKAVRGAGPGNTLNRLMRRVQTRTFDLGDEDELYADWTTSTIVVTTVRPLDAVPVPPPGDTVELAPGVMLAGHATLQATAHMSSVSEAGRDIGNLLLPPILRDDPQVAEPLQFSATRGGDPGLSVLELNGVADHTVVTRTQPLVLRVDLPLGVDEHVLPVGFDGEFFLPLGRGRRVDGAMEIELERLPAPVTAGVRDLRGSIRIMFQKIVGQRLGADFEYPLLASARVTAEGTVIYRKEPDEVRELVAGAQRIVLYIHGIIGDTRGMVASARGVGLKLEDPPPFLGERYDLMLAFDYENINTTIEETARGLKRRLEAVGLGAGHGKRLHVVAHSMGGLVARWFVEREGGNAIVQHLTMLGTPNAGSPWPTVQAWATTALGIGLNSLSVVAWPVRALGSLMGAIETVDVTLDQMAPGSDFYQTLTASADPGIPYTVIAGNTSILPAALEAPEGQESRMARLMNRLLHETTALAFFGEPNDIAASVQSIESIPPGRSPQPEIREVACDHITYFNTAAGLSALAEALP